jgi:hypothetical protein
MDELASFITTLNHRHYGEGAYEHRKKQSSLTDLKIITYGAATSLKSLYRYVDQEYLKRAAESPAKVLLGLAGVAELDDKKIATMANTIVAIARQLQPTIQLHLHAACHIKLLSHDGVAYLGSQNLSNGAEPYFEGANSSKEYFNRFHEVVLKVEGTDLAWVNTLFYKVLSDHQLCIEITSEHKVHAKAQDLAKRFVHKAELARIIENITTGLLLKEFLQKKPEFMAFEINESSSIETCKLVNAIVQEDSPEVALDSLKELLLPETDFSWIKQEGPIAELKHIISRLEDDFPGKVALQNKLEDERSLFLTSESDENIVEAIRKIAQRHDLESLDEYLQKQRNNIVHSIIESPDYSKHYMFGAIDNDGNVSEELLNWRFSDTDVEWDEDEDGNPQRHERDAMSLNEKLNEVDVRSLRIDLYEVFSREINKLWVDEVIELSNSLFADLHRLYERELSNHDFMAFANQVRAGQPGEWSSRWRVPSAS